jgi:pyruvate/2-oxoglutarate dehydrogenase complex dihydrolipoamide dehydrogenase (E3) component/uncharacterized membrane protein YdjX (TVP38/TMEM64 family)
MKKFDVIVIGAGSGGLTSAIGLTKVGKKVLLIEKEFMGGDCTNFGCIPSKSLIHHAQDYFTAVSLAGETPELKKYKESILGRVRKMVLDIRKEESPEKLEEHFPGLTVIRGEAKFKDSHQVKVAEELYQAKRIIIATGSSPRMIKVKGLEEKKTLNNKNIFDLEEIPKNLVILGGGAIACELAEAFAMIGSKVSIIVRSKIMRTEEPEISEQVKKNFQAIGIDVLEGANIDKCEDGKVILGKKQVAYDYILLALGRTANCQHLNLSIAGVEFNENGIVVNSSNRTTRKNIFAVGDVASEHKFTHVADDQGRSVIKKIIFPFATTTKKTIPKVTYLREELASTGMTYEEALKKYSEKEIIKVTVPFKANDRAKTDEVTEGMAIIIARRISGKVLGASILSKNAGEIISFFTLAIQNKISLWKINNIIFPYPVLGLIIKKASDLFIGQSVANLKKDLLYKIKKNLPKLVAVLFWAFIIHKYFSYKAAHDLSSIDIVKEMYMYFTGTAYGPILYIGIYALRPVLFFPATLLTLLSGALFGVWVGIFYTVIGENLSANFAYFLGRSLGKDIIPRDGLGLLSTWKRKLSENSFISVLIMRFVYLPFDLVNYGCGILNVKWRSYFLATLIGIMPGLVTFVSFGASIKNVDEFKLTELGLDPMQLTVSIVLFVSSLLIAKEVKKRHSKATGAKA